MLVNELIGMHLKISGERIPLKQRPL
jgi:hypothetical protein